MDWLLVGRTLRGEAGSSNVSRLVLREKVCVGWFRDGENINGGGWFFECASADFLGKCLGGLFCEMGLDIVL